MEDIDIKLEDLQHSIDIEEDISEENKYDSNSCCESKTEEMELKLEDLHHSIDIKEDNPILKHQSNTDLQLLEANNKILLCGFCDYKSAHKGHFNVHLGMHAEEKPFKCQICDYKCAHKFLPIDSKMEKGTRCKNFTSDEIDLLTTLVSKYRSILECKKSGVVSNKQKKLVWQKLAKEFNVVSASTEESQRSAKVLKDKWSNIKKTAVKNRSNIASKSHVTSTTTSVDISVQNILAERMTELVAESNSDSAAVVTIENESENMVEVALKEMHDKGKEVWLTTVASENELVIEKMSANNELEVIESIDCSSTKDNKIINMDWPDHPLNVVKSPVPEQIRRISATKTTCVHTKDKRNKSAGLTTNQKWCNLVDKKKQFLEVQEQLAREEHEEKMEFLKLQKQFLKEKHELEMQIMREQHTAQIEQLLSSQRDKK